MKKLLISTALITSAAFGITACSSVNAATDSAPIAKPSAMHQDGARQHKRLSNHAGKKPFAELNLSADQEAKIKAIMQKNHNNRSENFEALKNERKTTQAQVQNLANSPTLNNAELNRLANLEAEKTRQRFVNRVQMQREIAQVLTPEQRQKLATMKSERQNNRANHTQKRSQHAKYQSKSTAKQ